MSRENQANRSTDETRRYDIPSYLPALSPLIVNFPEPSAFFTGSLRMRMRILKALAAFTMAHRLNNTWLQKIQTKIRPFSASFL